MCLKLLKAPFFFNITFPLRESEKGNPQEKKRVKNESEVSKIPRDTSATYLIPQREEKKKINKL